MLDTRHDRLALALIALAGVLLASSAMQPDHGRVILLTAQDLMDRRPGTKADLADWVMAAALSAQEQAQAEQETVNPGVHAALAGVAQSLSRSQAKTSAIISRHVSMSLSGHGQWHLTSLPPPLV